MASVGADPLVLIVRLIALDDRWPTLVHSLEQSKEPLDQGILTQAEFDAQKQKILSAM